MSSVVEGVLGLFRTMLSVLQSEPLNASPSIVLRAELALLFITASASSRNVPSGSPIVIEPIKGYSVSRSLNAKVGK